MTRTIRPRPIDPVAFAPFGDVLDTQGEPDKIINQGLCERYDDRARLDFAGGRAGISIFQARPRTLPLELMLVERHPLGSQAFIPMSMTPFLVIVAGETDNGPDRPLAFLTAPGQAINLHRDVWHGVLTPLSEPGLFAVIDRIGAGDNLVEHWFEAPWRIEAPERI